MPQYFGENVLTPKILFNRTYHTVHSRLQVENSMLKDGHVNMQEIEDSASFYGQDEEEEEEEEEDEESDEAV